MSHASCSQEAAVAKAARAGELPQALAAHAAQCAVCRDVVQATLWMHGLAGSDSAQLCSGVRPLPDPGLIWWRAHLEDDPVEAKKIRTVLEWAQVALSAAVPLAAAGWVAWNWYPIEAVAEQFLLNTWPQLAALTYLASLAPAALTMAALLLTYPLLAGE